MILLTLLLSIPPAQAWVSIKNIQIPAGRVASKYYRNMTLRSGEKVQLQEGKMELSTPRLDVKATAPFELQFISDEVISILSGKVLVTTKGQKSSVFRPVVKTPSVTMGVRGTQFMAVYFPLLGESEIIAFKDEVEMTDMATNKKVTVKEGHWGGKGGRFGQELVTPIQLNPAILKYFSSQF